LNFRPISLLAAFTAAAILPIAGPAQADAPIVPVMAINAIAAAEVPATAEKTLDQAGGEQPAPAFHAIPGGVATFYGRHLAGARTASGARYAPDALTAAHRTLPFGTQLQVTNPRTGASVVVTINDRGPFHSNRVLDLSDAAADQIGIRSAGSGAVQLAVLDN
jgi:rare lipoprotein A